MFFLLTITALAIFVAVIIGGSFALKFKDKLHLILGFSAGSVIGVAFFDLLTEAFKMSEGMHEPELITTLIVAGFLFFLILDRFLISHVGHDDECDNFSHKGTLGATSLSIHSLLDGLIVGLSFQVSTMVGVAISIAIFAHAFSDGINTVNIIYRAGGDSKKAKKWLFVDALAPVIGIFGSLFIIIPEKTLSLMIALFCGFFIYIGASDLLPESHHSHPKAWTTISTILGIILIYVVTKLGGL